MSRSGAWEGHRYQKKPCWVCGRVFKPTTGSAKRCRKCRVPVRAGPWVLRVPLKTVAA